MLSTRGLTLCLQTERAFQKQRGVFLNSKAGLSGKKKKKEQRFVRNVGLGFKTPREVPCVIPNSFFMNSLLYIGNKKASCVCCLFTYKR